MRARSFSGSSAESSARSTILWPVASWNTSMSSIEPIGRAPASMRRGPFGVIIASVCDGPYSKPSASRQDFTYSKSSRSSAVGSETSSAWS